MEHFTELFNKPAEDFKNHLLDSDNHRIVFSGIYGIGKTTFIKYFFLPENISRIVGKEKLTPFYLTPVNYSVSSNEDIFEYIKCDILLQLLAHPDLKLDGNFSKRDTLPFYLRNSLDSIAISFMNFLPKIEKKAFAIPKSIIDLINAYQDFHKKITSANKDSIQKFEMSLIQKEGSIYEFNSISQIITCLLEEFKSQNNTKTILIIDDLDRLDPEHIFRLFNVFASHIDYDSINDNKFGFDKILFVCDIDNVRRIFHNKYGANVDFNGYIDKFYSKEVFKFDIRKSLIPMIQKVLRSISFSLDPNENNYFGNLISQSRSLLWTIQELISQDKLNLRTFFKYYESSVSFTHDEIFLSEQQHPVSTFQSILEIKLLVDFYGDPENLIESLDYCRKNMMRNLKLENHELLSTIIYLLDIHHNKLEPDESKTFTYIDPQTEIKCYYKLKQRGVYGFEAQILKPLEFPTDFKGDKYQYNNLLYFQMLLVKQLYKIGYLK